MNIPTTGFEENGTWTTLAKERELLEQIASETTAELSEAGRTVEDRPILRLDLGNGPNTMLIVGLQHGAEPAGREAAFQLIRDMAYSDDPEVLNYLSNHRIVFIPSVNADGAFNSRNNKNDVNLNRDWFQLSQPETQAVMSVWREVNPHLVVDLHENGIPLEDWTGTTEMIAGSHSGLVGLGDSLQAHIIESVQNDGRTAGAYPRTSTPVAGIASAAGAFHSVGSIHEPYISLPRPERVESALFGLRSVPSWHKNNSLALNLARIKSLTASYQKQPIPLVTSEMTSGGIATTLYIDGYTLDEPIPDHLVSLHGIHVEGDFVSIHQPAKIAIVMICDPQSRDRVVTATRRNVPSMQRPEGSWVDTRVVINGASTEVAKAWHVVDGIRIPIRLPKRQPQD